MPRTKASYNVHVDDMEDDEFSGDIVEKKQFLVSNGRLKDAVDTDSNINDAILLEALGGNSGVKMKNVVATIQKEQDAIIRNRTAYQLAAVVVSQVLVETVETRHDIPVGADTLDIGVHGTAQLAALGLRDLVI